MVPIIGAIGAGLGIANGIKSLFGDGGGDPIAQLAAAQQKSLAQTAQMQTMTAEFQSAQEALRAVSEALTAGHDANMASLEKVGSAAR